MKQNFTIPFSITTPVSFWQVLQLLPVQQTSGTSFHFIKTFFSILILNLFITD